MSSTQMPTNRADRHLPPLPAPPAQVIASRPNVCKQLHMPAQSGSSAVLERMRRGYTREAYDELVATVRAAIPAVALSTDIISGGSGAGWVDGPGAEWVTGWWAR